MASQIQKVIAELAKIGFTEKETRLYLKLRTLGSSSVQEIASAMAWNRTTTVNVLSGLMDKGLVAQTILNGKKMFVAEHERKIHAVVEEREWHLQKLQDDLPSLQKDLDSICPIQSVENNDETKIEYFEGKKDVAEIYDRVLKQWGGNIYTYADMEKVFYFFPENAEKFQKAVGNMKGKMWEILVDSEETQKYINEPEYKQENYQCSIVPQKYKINIDCMIFEDTIVMITLEENPTATIIKNKRIANTYRNIFFLAWQFFTKEKLYE